MFWRWLSKICEWLARTASTRSVTGKKISTHLPDHANHELTKTLLQFPTDSRPKAWFLFLSINAPLAFFFFLQSIRPVCSCGQRKGLTVSTAPSTTWLCTVALYLPLFARLAPLFREWAKPVRETLGDSRRNPVNPSPFPRSFTPTATTVLPPVVFGRIIMVATPSAVRCGAVAVGEAVDSRSSAECCRSSRWRRGSSSRCGLRIWRAHDG